MLVCALLVLQFSSAVSESEEDLFFVEYSDWRMRSMPEYASGVGFHRYDDRLSDPSPEGARWVRQDSNSFKSFVGMSIKASLTSSLLLKFSRILSQQNTIRFVVFYKVFLQENCGGLR